MGYYLVKYSQKDMGLGMAAIFLIVALILNYLVNFTFLIMAKFTLFIDPHFRKLTHAHKEYFILLVAAVITTHSGFILWFSRLFDVTGFKLYLENINNLRIPNYLWGFQIVVWILACLSGIVRIITY